MYCNDIHAYIKTESCIEYVVPPAPQDIHVEVLLQGMRLLFNWTEVLPNCGFLHYVVKTNCCLVTSNQHRHFSVFNGTSFGCTVLSVSNVMRKSCTFEVKGVYCGNITGSSRKVILKSEFYVMCIL